jgi:hypothetical protein
MTIIDTVKMPGYTQWIENFVMCVLDAADIAANEVRITEMNNKRIYIICDNKEYMIRTVNFFPAGEDENGITCSEDVEYILYVGHEFCEEVDDLIHLQPIDDSVLNIRWVNSAALYLEEIRQYHALHGEPQMLEAPKDGEYAWLKVHDLNDSSWDMKIDIRPLCKNEVAPVMKYFLTGELLEKYNTSKIRDYIKEIITYSVRGVLSFCFEDGVYYHIYTLSLIGKAIEQGRCSKECGLTKANIVHRLYDEYSNGCTEALVQLKATLAEFFMQTTPFYFTAI